LASKLDVNVVEHSVSLTSRDITVVALFSAVYVVYGVISSYGVGHLTHGIDTHLTRSLTVTVLAAYIGKFTAPTLMGVVSGLLLGFLIPAPFGLIYLPPSVFAYCLVYDVYMRQVGYPRSAANTRHILVATVIASVLMSIIALALLSVLQVFRPEVLLFAWIGELVGGTVLGIGGSLVAVRIVRQL
jgi:hypothetical protein